MSENDSIASLPTTDPVRRQACYNKSVTTSALKEEILALKLKLTNNPESSELRGKVEQLEDQYEQELLDYNGANCKDVDVSDLRRINRLNEWQKESHNFLFGSIMLVLAFLLLMFVIFTFGLEMFQSINTGSSRYTVIGIGSLTLFFVMMIMVFYYKPK